MKTLARNDVTRAAALAELRVRYLAVSFYSVRIFAAQPSSLVPFSPIRETDYFYSFSSNKTG